MRLAPLTDSQLALIIPRTPYGGMKESGIGRQGGLFSLDFYSEQSTVCMKF